MDDDKTGEPEVDEQEAAIAALEAEAARLEERAWTRRHFSKRTLLLLQAPVVALLAVALLLAGRSSSQAVALPAQLGLAQAHLDAPLKAGAPMYAYVTFKNTGGSPERLVTVTSPWARTITLTDSHGRPVPWIEIPAHSTLTLTDKTARIVMTDLTRAPEHGDTIQLDLGFAQSGVVHVFAPVGPASSLTVLAVVEAMKYMDRLPPQ